MTIFSHSLFSSRRLEVLLQKPIIINNSFLFGACYQLLLLLLLTLKFVCCQAVFTGIDNIDSIGSRQ